MRFKATWLSKLVDNLTKEFIRLNVKIAIVFFNIKVLRIIC